MKLFICESPIAVLLAADENHARVLMGSMFINPHKFELIEVDTSTPGMVLPPKSRRVDPDKAVHARRV